MSCFIVCLLLDVSHFTYFSIPIDYPLRGILVIFGLSFTVAFLIFRTIPYFIFICQFSDYPLRYVLDIFGLSFTITFLIFRTIPYLIFICLFSDYPGQCPVQNYFAVTCTNFCTSDVDCLKNYKCCGTENCGEQTQCVPGKKSLYNTGILT